MGFQISSLGPRALRELVQKSLDVCVHTAKWAFSSRHWQFINWDPRHFLLEYFADTFSTHLFLFPNHLSLPIRKREILDSQKEKMCCFPPKWLFVSDFLGFLRSKNLAWWPLNFRSPKALLLEKPSALNKERGGENHWMCSPNQVLLPTPYCVARPLLWIQGPPPHPQKMHNMGFFFLFLFSSLQKGKSLHSGNGTTINTKHANQEPCFVLLPPLTRKRGTSLSEKKKQGRKKENDNLGCQKKK
jgi:hypothetical protein